MKNFCIAMWAELDNLSTDHWSGRYPHITHRLQAHLYRAFCGGAV